MRTRLRRPVIEAAPTQAAAAAVPAAPSRGLAGRLGALSQPRYRRYWLGSLCSVGGVQLVTLGQGWLIVDELGGSPLDLGFLGGATAGPTILVNLFGGVLADRVDRRALLVATSLVCAVLLALLATLDVTDAVEIWHVIAVAAGLGMVFGVDWPARNAFFPALIDREYMMNAVALNAAMWQGTRIIAPAIGGVVIAVSDTSAVFYAASVGFVAMAAILLTLDAPSTAASGPRNVFGELAEGIRFIASRRLFTVLILLAFAASFFGLEYIQLMPLMAEELDVGASRLGFMFMCIGLGAVTGTVVTVRWQGGRNLGRMMLGGVFFSSLTIAGFAASPVYAVALLLIYAAALFNSIFLIASMTALQMRVPDELRGRVMGIHAIAFSFIPLGGLLGGAVAEVTNVRVAIAVAALALTGIVAVVALTQREVRELQGGAHTA